MVFDFTKYKTYKNDKKFPKRLKLGLYETSIIIGPLKPAIDGNEFSYGQKYRYWKNEYDNVVFNEMSGWL